LFLNVTHFCEAYGLEDKIPIFKKAALAAQHPHDIENINELDEDDKHHLRREVTRMQNHYHLHQGKRKTRANMR
jgi:hypothetical protein